MRCGSAQNVDTHGRRAGHDRRRRRARRRQGAADRRHAQHRTSPRRQLSGATLSLASGRIGFGGGSGLVLDPAALAALANTQHLTLRSYSSIDFHQRASICPACSAVTFDAAALVGYGTTIIDVVANRLVLENTASTLQRAGRRRPWQLDLVAARIGLWPGRRRRCAASTRSC